MADSVDKSAEIEKSEEQAEKSEEQAEKSEEQAEKSEEQMEKSEEQAGEQERLRYLAFVHAGAVQAVLLLARIYVYARESAGPLKPRIQSVEGTVKTVVGPVYGKYHAVPFEALKFVDRKVGETVEGLERRVPSVVQDATAAAKSAAGEVHRAGLVGSAAGLACSAYARCEPAAKGLYARCEPAARGLYAKYEPAAKGLYAKYEPAAKGLYAKYEPAAKGLYTKYEPAAEKAAASAWRSLNRLPLVPRVAQVVVPTAADLSEKYNRAVCSSAEKGYAVSAYLPLVPTERIARVFAGETAAAH